jgi:NAD(P) transhydrogenase subunit beta
MLVGASGTLLTLLMAKAMNRSVANVLFGAFGQVQAGAGRARADDGRTVRATTADDVAVQLSFARKVIVVPGYGMAVAQAQHDVASSRTCSRRRASTSSTRSTPSRAACRAT